MLHRCQLIQRPGWEVSWDSLTSILENHTQHNTLKRQNTSMENLLPTLHRRAVGVRQKRQKQLSTTLNSFVCLVSLLVCLSLSRSLAKTSNIVCWSTAKISYTHEIRAKKSSRSWEAKAVNFHSSIEQVANHASRQREAFCVPCKGMKKRHRKIYCAKRVRETLATNYNILTKKSPSSNREIVNINAKSQY